MSCVLLQISLNDFMLPGVIVYFNYWGLMSSWQQMYVLH